MQKAIIDLSKKGIIPVFHAKQGDTSRRVAITLLDNGLPYDTAAEAVSVWYSGPSGEGNYSDGIDKDGSTLTILVNPNMTAASGRQTCAVMLSNESGRCTTWNFCVEVAYTPALGSEEAKAYFEAFEAGELAADIAAVDARTAKAVANLNARVSAIIASGTATEGNTELIDIRTGADGKVYQTAGDAVREQVEGIKSDLAMFGEITVSTNRANPLSFTKDYRLSNAGYPIAESGYVVSDWIDISDLTNVTIYVNNKYPHYKQGVGIRFYEDKTNTCLSDYNARVVSDNIARSIKKPSNANYIRIVWNYNDGLDTNKVYVGSDSIDNFVFTKFGSKKTEIYPSDEVVNARGNYNSLNGRLESIESNIIPSNKTVFYFGDSLTQGNQDGTTTSRASVLKALLGEEWNVKNYGVGGEKSNTISARGSGSWFYLDAGVTIPGDGSTINVGSTIHDMYGESQNLGNGAYSSAYGGWATINPCVVNGVECTLQKANASSPLTIKRNSVGDDINITRPTRIHFNSETFEKNPVLILCFGQNEGFNRDAKILIEQIDGVIEHNKSDRYIVVCIPHSLYGYTWEKTINDELKRHYGKHYLDIEEYMKTPVYDADGETIVSSYALQDAGLTPTDADLTAISKNQYSPQIMFDAVHFNHYGYEVWANQEYELGKDLEYWN